MSRKNSFTEQNFVQWKRCAHALGAAGAIVLLLVAVAKTQEPQKPKVPVPPATPAASSAAVPASTHELTAADLEAFLDGLMPAQLEREDIAGATIAVVRDGKVLLAKGYGFSDVEKRKPVSPDNTLFRPGSISKLFTWTAVMQQVEQGKLDLDRDVNEYLDFKIPPAFGKPITLRNIMTHTPGFEDTAKELFVADAGKMRPLSEYLREHIPARIFPPGITPAYSNYATTIAGYIVQRLSGKPFEQYIAENIYVPLGMRHTTFEQPLPPDLLPLMSNGYLRASQPAKPFEFVQAYPAGSVSTSALDMCNFMMAHLQDGQLNGKQILKPETAKQMHARVFGSDPRLNGMALGFYEETKNGHRIIGHGGDTVYFHSDLHLIHDANVGFFVSYNSAGKGEVSERTILFDKFLDRYFPFTPAEAARPASAKEDAAQVSGLYVVSRRGEKSFLKVTELLGQPKVFTNPDGTLSIDPLKSSNGELKRFEQIAPMLYREQHGQDLIGFHKNPYGKTEFSIDFPFFVFERASLVDNKYFNLSIVIPSIVIIALTVLLWPVGAAIRKHYGQTLELTALEKRLRLAVRAVCILDLAVLIGWVIYISGTEEISNLSRSRDPFLLLLQVLGIVAVFGTAVVLIDCFQSISKRALWIWSKISSVALAFACLGFVWFIWHWNLINFNLHY
jgi:CubicO group peptidase (beta-lactamase class C family)